MSDAFQRSAFQSPGFQLDESEEAASFLDEQRIPRWLLKFERTGKTIFLSDVGGEVKDQFYIPAVVDVSISSFQIDLSRFTAPSPSATVHISPSALKEFFLDVDDLGQALVTLSSWDGRTIRSILRAKLEQPEWGYDGEVTSFRLSEDFDHNSSWPTDEELDDDGNFVWVDNGILNAKQLFNYLIGVSGYPATQDVSADTPVDTMDGQNIGVMNLIRKYLKHFEVSGKANSPTPIFSFIAERLQREFLFVLWQESGLLTGAIIDPTAPPQRAMVYGVDLIQLQRPIKEDSKYTSFKVRYNFDIEGDAGWQSEEILNRSNNPYLKSFSKRWGKIQFGDSIDKPRDANAVSLADVSVQSAAQSILHRLVMIFHRGQFASYLQRAPFAEFPYGMPVLLIDAERDYNEKPAILVGREWLTPEWVVHTYRTIEPMEDETSTVGRVTVSLPEPPPPPPSLNLAPEITGECWAGDTDSHGVTVDVGGGRLIVNNTDSSADSISFNSCRVTVEPGMVFDYGIHADHTQVGFYFSIFRLHLMYATTPGGPAVGELSNYHIALQSGTDSPYTPPGNSMNSRLNGINNFGGAVEVWLKAVVEQPTTVAFSAPYLRMRDPLTPPEHPDSNSCYFPSDPGVSCFGT